MKITPCDIITFVSVVLPLIAVETGAYKKSYSTFLMTLVTPLIVYFNHTESINPGNIILVFIVGILLLRAIVQKEDDRLLKR
jgi:hypothetical protein